MILAQGKKIGADCLPPEVLKERIPWDEFSIKKASRILEEELIRKALKKTSGNRSQAVRILEISHPALLSKMKEYGIED
jgi:two-component system response regulator AtoC